MTLDSIVDALARHQLRATYGAVAPLVGRPATFLMQGIARGRRYSWVVNKETLQPTGYSDEEKDPALTRHPQVLRTPAEVALLVQDVDVWRRRRFAEVLNRLCEHGSAHAEWKECVSEHYHDVLLDAVRRECVRLLNGNAEGDECSEAKQRQLKAWAVALASSTYTNPSNEEP